MKKVIDMSEIVKNRSEMVFIYDVSDANPNGDPLDENKPRIDEETGMNIVTDVRLKRTIRDYLMNFKEEEIFVKEIVCDDEGHIQDAKRRAKDFVELIGDEEEEEKEVVTKFRKGEKIKKTHVEKIKNNIRSNLVKKAIDIRLFGATVPLEFKSPEIEGLDKNKSITSSVTLTGPVQFKMARSMHKVEIKHIKGTGAFASKEGASQKTFREEYILPYSLIRFYGIINENAAKHTKLTDDDVTLLLDAIWDGTKNLISRSKIGQIPRVLLKVNYKKTNYHIGDLEKLIKLTSSKRDEEIRDISEIKLDATELVKILNENKDNIENIDLKLDKRVDFDLDGLDSAIKINRL